jgi:hypothetical protein
MLTKVVEARSMAIELTSKAYLPRQSMERSADVVLVQSSSTFGNEEKVRGRLAFEVLASTRFVHRQHSSRRTVKGNQSTLAKLRSTVLSKPRSADPHHSAGVKEPH